MRRSVLAVLRLMTTSCLAGGIYRHTQTQGAAALCHKGTFGVPKTQMPGI
jgi:hypothetical protein